MSGGCCQKVMDPHVFRPLCVHQDWLFGGAWPVLYVLQGVASWIVWNKGGEPVGPTPVQTRHAVVLVCCEQRQRVFVWPVEPTRRTQPRGL